MSTIFRRKRTVVRWSSSIFKDDKCVGWSCLFCILATVSAALHLCDNFFVLLLPLLGSRFGACGIMRNDGWLAVIRLEINWCARPFCRFLCRLLCFPATLFGSRSQIKRNQGQISFLFFWEISSQRGRGEEQSGLITADLPIERRCAGRVQALS